MGPSYLLDREAALRSQVLCPQNPLKNIHKQLEIKRKAGEHTHPMNILDERTRNAILECLLIVLGPVFPPRLVLWEVMDTASSRLAKYTDSGQRATYVEKYALSSSSVETPEARSVT